MVLRIKPGNSPELCGRLLDTKVIYIYASLVLARSKKNWERTSSCSLSLKETAIFLLCFQHSAALLSVFAVGDHEQRWYVGLTCGKMEVESVIQENSGTNECQGGEFSCTGR